MPSNTGRIENESRLDAPRSRVWNAVANAAEVAKWFGVDYSHGPRTLVTFMLSDVDGDTLLKVVESGFDGIPEARRAKAFEMDSKGSTSQMKNIEKHLAKADTARHE